MCDRSVVSGACNESCPNNLTNESCPLDSNLNRSFWPDCETSSASAIDTVYFHTFVWVMYSVIFLVALTGNGLVCYVVHSSPRMRTVTNLFIVNLAVGDILMALFCVPFTFVTALVLQYWPFGPTMCSAVSYSQAVSVFVSAYTLVAISIDRFMAIMWPLKPRMGKRQAKVVILVVWLIAVLTALPIALVSQVDLPSWWHKHCNKGVCREVWENEDHRTLYSMSLLFLQYIIPVLVLVFTYSSIAAVVWGKRPPGEAENCRDQRMARSKRKMIKMMVIVVVVFTVCWLPINVVILVMESNPDLSMWQGLPFLWFAVHWLAMSHTCYNPVIYCWMNARFRAGFISVLHIPKKYQGGHSTNEHSALHRHNTSNTYVSSRREPSHSLKSLGNPYKCETTLHYEEDEM